MKTAVTALFFLAFASLLSACAAQPTAAPPLVSGPALLFFYTDT